VAGNGDDWIKLIFAGRNRIIMIRRELPLTNGASRPSLSHREAEDSPSCLLRLRLTLSSIWITLFHWLICFCFFLIWKVFAFVLSVPFMPSFVACRPLRP